MKRIISLLLVLFMLIPMTVLAQEAAELRGYDKKNGYQYVAFGNFAYDTAGNEAPLLWRVLTVKEDTALLLTEYIVDFYYTNFDSQQYYKAKNWTNSSLYTYLQNDFAHAAFSEEELSTLVPDAKDGDIVGLLRTEDVRNAAYGFASDNDRKCAGTPYAKSKQLTVEWPKYTRKYTLYTYRDGNSPWFLRDKSADSPSMQREILDKGKVGKVGCTNADVGVRPAVWVKLSEVEILSGSGTKADPFVLNAKGAASAAQTQPSVLDVTPAPQPTVAPSPTQTPSVKTDDQTESTVFTAAADPAGIHERFPALTAEGFLPEGEEEFVLQDADQGLWLYCSQTLRVQIERISGTSNKKPLLWYEAHIYTRDASEVFDLYPYNEEKYTNIYTRALPQDMAKQHKLVFSINTDYFIYRVERAKEEKSYAYPIGTQIRDGKVLYTQTRGADHYTYPPLDVLALYPDGDMRVFPNTLHYSSNLKTATVEFMGQVYSFEYKKGDKLNARLQAEQAMGELILSTGATDTLCFGPILIRDGQKADTRDWGTSANPRTAIGMVEKGHYVSIVVDGRGKNSNGESCIWLMDRMYELGCTLAFNLDGGATSAMMFMGKQISVAGNYANGLTKRGQNELLGIGVSDLVE